VLAERVDVTTIRYVSVHARGPYRHYEFLLHQSVVESPELNAFLSLVVAEGGYWERLWVGWLLLSLPSGSLLDPKGALEGISGGV